MMNFICSLALLASLCAPNNLGALSIFKSNQVGSSPANGYVLQTDGSSSSWVATSTLGLGSGGGSGTVTSVAASVPTGLTVSGSPITTSGTLAFNWDTGYGPVLTASSSNWNSFYDTPSSRITAGTNLSWDGNTLNATGGSGGSGLGTTSPWSGSGLAYRVSDAAVSSVATSSLTINAPLTTSGTPGALVGGTNLTLDIDDIKAADLDLTDITLVDFTNDAGFINSTAGDWTGTLDGLEASAFEQGLTAGDGLTRTVNDFDCDTASGSVFGCLSSADWTTFNNKQSTLTGTQGQVAYFSGTNSAIGTSSLFIAPSTNVGVGTTSPGSLLSIGSTNGINFVSGASTTATSTMSGNLDLLGALSFKNNGQTNYFKQHRLGFLDLVRDGADYTLMRVRAPLNDSNEATLSLVVDRDTPSAGVNEEFIDFYNERYADSVQWGIRQAYSGTGIAKPGVFGFWNTAGGKDVGNQFLLMPNGTSAFARATSTVDTNAQLYVASSTAAYPLIVDAAPGSERFSVSSTGTTTATGASSATSTIYMQSTAAGKGGTIILEDTDGAGCTEISALNGVLSAKTVTCP